MFQSLTTAHCAVTNDFYHRFFRPELSVSSRAASEVAAGLQGGTLGTQRRSPTFFILSPAASRGKKRKNMGR